MGYKPEVYQKAINILERRRENATFEANSRMADITEKIPEIEKIQQKLSAIGFNISKVFLYGEDKAEEVEKLKRASLELQREKKVLLKKNGFSEDALSVKYICLVCNDTGYVNNRMCNCQKELLKEIERNSLRQLAPIEDCTFDKFDVRYYPETSEESAVSPRQRAEKILNSCRLYAQSFSSKSPNLLLMGKTGLGKTHLSLAIANVAINKGFSVTYGTSYNILSDLQNENFGRADKGSTYNEYEVLHTDLLIIDDLGTEFKSTYTNSCLYNIINTRILQKRPTIINTNYDFLRFDEIYDQRLTSRIAGEYQRLYLEGNDIRYIK